MRINQRGSVLPIMGVIILIVLVGLGAYFLGKYNSKTDSQLQISMLSQTPTVPLFSNTPAQETKNNITVKVVAGDIVVTKDGQDKKITDWGYNDKPVLSPDGMRVAYVSKTKESFENEKKYQGYVPSSTNLWIINTDGSNELQVTKHDNWIYRDNLLWLDNNRILFTEGVSSARVYSLQDKSNKVVLGPEKPEGICVDACGAGSEFIYTPDKSYLVLLAFEGIGGIVTPPPSAILNTKTLKSVQIKQKFGEFNTRNVVFNTNLLILETNQNPNESLVQTTINLDTGKVTFKQ